MLEQCQKHNNSGNLWLTKKYEKSSTRSKFRPQISQIFPSVQGLVCAKGTIICAICGQTINTKSIVCFDWLIRALFVYNNWPV